MVFLSSKLVSFNKKLSAEFIKHIENTDNLCLYKLGSHYIPNNIIFSNAKSVTLINCSKYGILNILHPAIFPNISTINYLSIGTNMAILQRFTPNTKWVFPDKNYEFYNILVKSGVGKKDPELINKYIKNKKIIDGKNGFDISYNFDLNIPGYGIINGEWYQGQFYEYLVKRQNDNLLPEVVLTDGETIKQEYEEQSLQKEIVKEKVANAYLDDVFRYDSD